MLLVGCRGTEFYNNITDDKKYYPLEIGQWTEFDVDSIVYNDFFDPPRIDSSSCIIRFELTDTFRDNSESLNYILTRYWKPVDSAEYLVDVVWRVQDLGSSIQQVEENQRIVKMVFPLKTTTSWKANSFFYIEEDYDYMKKAWDFQVSGLHSAQSFSGNTFDSVLTVEMIDSNLIEKNIYLESYAKNTGLVYRHNVHLEKQNIDGNWENGFDIEFRLRDFKK